MTTFSWKFPDRSNLSGPGIFLTGLWDIIMSALLTLLTFTKENAS